MKLQSIPSTFLVYHAIGMLAKTSVNAFLLNEHRPLPDKFGSVTKRGLYLPSDTHPPLLSLEAPTTPSKSREDKKVSPSPTEATKEINPSNMISSVTQLMDLGLSKHVVFQSADNQIDTHDGGRSVTINEKRLVNFGSCSYLGLETDDALIQGSIEAAKKYGTQLSVSRAYVSQKLYDEVEDGLTDMFGKPVMVSGTTTLGHLSAMPVLVGDDDAVILDMQVHSSVQMAAQLLKARGIPLHVVRHNDMDALEKKIKSINGKHRKVWYFADGVYSMYGDYAKYDELEKLLDRYSKLNLYIDDAHGFSWTGEKGTGSTRKFMSHHDRLVLAVSFSKSFGSTGGAIVFANKEQRDLVRKCGGTVVFSSAIPPPMLGAIKASIDFHNSDKLKARQDRVRELIAYCNDAIAKAGLPQYDVNDSPIFFIPAGVTDIAVDMVSKVAEDGYQTNVAGYPAVPMRRTGLRFMVNYHVTEDDIDGLIASIRRHYEPVITNHGASLQDISRNFRIPPIHLNPTNGESPIETDLTVNKDILRTETLEVEEYSSVEQVGRETWNSLFAGNGNLDYDSLLLQEKMFCLSEQKNAPESRWKFRYFVARSAVDKDKIVAATFFTSALVKDDMLSSSKVSEKVESERIARNDPYYLTSKAIVLGSMGSMGDHLYLNSSATKLETEQAMRKLTQAMERLQQEEDASQIMLLSMLPESIDGTELVDYMMKLGYSRHKFPESYHFRNVSWKTEEEYLASLSSRNRYDLRKFALNHADGFVVETNRLETQEEIQQCYELYQQVFDRSTAVSTFEIPYEAFCRTVTSTDAEVLRIYAKNDLNTPIAMTYNHVHDNNFSSILIGFQKGGAGEHVNLYLLTLYQTIIRAIELGSTSIDFGYTNGLTKKKLGATEEENVGFVQAIEMFHQMQLASSF